LKIAIIGAGAMGVELAIKFHLEGAAVSLFEAKEVGGNLLLTPDKNFNIPFKDLISMDSLSLLKTELENVLANISLEERPSYKEYVELYLVPLAKYISKFHNVTHTEVLRVQKRYILKDEKIENKSRLSDLFRVVYINDPKNKITAQMKENPEAFKELDSEVIESLSRAMEGYQDFDLVIDTTAKSLAKRCGNGTYCIGEKLLSNVEGLYYGQQIFENIDKLKEDKTVAVIGSGETAARAINEVYADYDGKKRIFHITTEEKPFEKLETENSELYFQLTQTLEKESTHFSELKNRFLEKLEDWNELEDYMKAKIPRPAEPISNYVVFSGHNVSSLDRLIDKDSFFITCEIPNFRSAQAQKENAIIPLKTISTNSVLVATGYEKDHGMFDGLNILKGQLIHIDEPGFYSPVENDFSNLIFEKVSTEIFENVLTFFKRA
jgi:hypothetical protein